MGVHGTLRSAYLGVTRGVTDSRLTDYRWFLEQEVDSWGNWTSMPLRRRLWLWRHGFPSSFGEIYDFDAHDPEKYVSELQRYRLYNALNGRHRYLVDDKLSQYWMLSDHPKARPAAYGLVDRGHVHGTAGTEFDGDPAPVREWLPSALRRHSKLVLKQLRGKGGKQVVVAEYDGGFVLDGESVSEGTLCERVAELSGYLVTEYVDQHAYADELYPHAANTIRLLTVWDDKNGELLVPIAVHRIGTDRSRPIDNCSAGGLTAEIDLETGELGKAAQYPFWGSDGVPWYATHPDTGATIEGTAVPDWGGVRSTVEGIALENTNIPALGWDVVIDESGDPVVIEANTGTALRTLQIHRPLLEDGNLAALVARHLGGSDAEVPGR